MLGKDGQREDERKNTAQEVSAGWLEAIEKDRELGVPADSNRKLMWETCNYKYKMFSPISVFSTFVLCLCMHIWYIRLVF